MRTASKRDACEPEPVASDDLHVAGSGGRTARCRRPIDLRARRPRARPDARHYAASRHAEVLTCT